MAAIPETALTPSAVPTAPPLASSEGGTGGGGRGGNGESMTASSRSFSKLGVSAGPAGVEPRSGAGTMSALPEAARTRLAIVRARDRPDGRPGSEIVLPGGGTQPHAPEGRSPRGAAGMPPTVPSCPAGPPTAAKLDTKVPRTTSVATASPDVPGAVPMAPQPAVWLANAFPLPPERVDMAHLMACETVAPGRPEPAGGCP